MTRPITLRTAPRTAVRKASKQVPVYDQSGRLVGVCNASDVQPLGSLSGDDVVDAAGAPINANDGPVAQAAQTANETADEVAKMLARLPRQHARPTIQKALGSSRTVDGQYDALLGSLPDHLADQLRTTVAVRSTHLAIGQNIAGPAAVSLIKRAVLDAARKAGR